MADNERDTPQYSLSERAYRGDDGQIHHHTNTYMEQHGGGSDERSASGSSRSSDDRAGESGRRLPKRAIAAAVGVAALAAAGVVAGRRLRGREGGEREMRDVEGGPLHPGATDTGALDRDENRDFAGTPMDSGMRTGGGSRGLDEAGPGGRDLRGDALDRDQGGTGSYGNRDGGSMY